MRVKLGSRVRFLNGLTGQFIINYSHPIRGGARDIWLGIILFERLPAPVEGLLREVLDIFLTCDLQSNIMGG